MTETLLRDQSDLHEFDGGLSHWQRDVTILKEVLRHQDGYEFEAQLPEIIGYVPGSERPVMKRWYDNGPDDPQIYWNDGRPPSWQALVDQIPDTIEIINKDIKLVSQEQRRLSLIEIDKRFVAEGEAPRGALLHVDGAVSSEEDTDELFYTLRSFEPTNFYRGPARLFAANGRPKDKGGIRRRQPGSFY